VLIGNGGSISSAKAFYEALSGRCEPRSCTLLGSELHVVDSMEPGLIAQVKRRSGAEDSVVLPVSKSGNTQGVLDALNPFIGWGYNLAAVTTKGSKAGRLYGLVKGILASRHLDLRRS